MSFASKTGFLRAGAGWIAPAALALLATPSAAQSQQSAAARRPLLGQKVALAGWRVAENRASCAPLALASNGGVPGSPRVADFSGGWGVAFDTARTRSAYGFAGTGLLPGDTRDHGAQRRAISNWPYTREVGETGRLPAGSFAGYGLEGGGRYSNANPRGLGQRSLAYLRIPGQPCLYNVWSKVSRAHLEKVLDSLRLIPGPLPAPGGRDLDFASWNGRLRAPSATWCNINSGSAVQCRLRRDADGVLHIRIGGKQPVLVSVGMDRADVFAIAGNRPVPIRADYRPHPGAMNCLWARPPGRRVGQIWVNVDRSGA